MNLTYDIQTVSNPVDDVPPLDLTTCGKIYLEFTMLSIPILTFLILITTYSALLTLLSYIMLMISVMYCYIFFVAQGKRGEFIFKKENTFILALSSVIIFIAFFTLTALFFEEQNTIAYKAYFDQTKSSYMGLFMCLFVFGLGTIEEYYWRNFLIKTLSSGWMPAMFVGLHYAFLIMIISINIVEWQYCVLLGLLSIIWHIAMVYARKLLKFSSVAIYGIVARIGIYSAFYILFLDMKWI